MRPGRGFAALAAAVGLVVAWPVFAAAAAPAPADTMPSYMLPNIVAIVMVATLVAVACKRFRQT